MNLTQKQKDDLIHLGIVKERLNFLNKGVELKLWGVKVEHIRSYVTFQDGITFTEIKKLVKNVTVFYEKSLARDLEKINNRKKLIYRGKQSIINNNRNHSKFIIR